MLWGEGPTAIHLGGEAGEDFRITPTEAYGVLMGGVATGLFISGLERVDFDQSAGCPCGVGGELVLDVGFSNVVHRGYNIQDLGIVVNKIPEINDVDLFSGCGPGYWVVKVNEVM